MAIETVPRGFSFRFSDLLPETPELSVVEHDRGPEPGEVDLMAAAQRPRWLPRLLPVFRAGDPLRVAIRGAAAPAFAARVCESLARLYAMAGAESGVRVGGWPQGGGFGVGGHGPARMTGEAHAQLVVAELERASVSAAVAELETVPPRSRWLVLHGDLRPLEPLLGVDRALAGLYPERVYRLPLFERDDLAAAVRGSAPGLGRKRTGLAFLRLAACLVRAYLADQP